MSLSVLPPPSTILRFSVCFIYNARGWFFAMLSGREIHTSTTSCTEPKACWFFLFARILHIAFYFLIFITIILKFLTEMKVCNSHGTIPFFFSFLLDFSLFDVVF